MFEILRAQYRFAGFCVFFGTIFFAGINTAQAIPNLQLYIEGATYVGGGEESWVLATPSTSFKVWAIGQTAGTGNAGPIFDARLSAVYDSSVGPLTINLTPGTTEGLGGFTDSSTPSTPTFTQISNSGNTPTIVGSHELPSHGEYGTGRTWQEFSLGNFTASDSPIGDFITSFPTASVALNAQINVYTVTVSKAVSLHFDLYGYTLKNNGTKQKEFAPFSHDAEGAGKPEDPPSEIPGVPEPGTLALLALGSIGLGGYRKLRSKKELAA